MTDSCPFCGKFDTVKVPYFDNFQCLKNGVLLDVSAKYLITVCLICGEAHSGVDAELARDSAAMRAIQS